MPKSLFLPFPHKVTHSPPNCNSGSLGNSFVYRTPRKAQASNSLSYYKTCSGCRSGITTQHVLSTVLNNRMYNLRSDLELIYLFSHCLDLGARHIIRSLSQSAGQWFRFAIIINKFSSYPTHI